MTTHEDGRPLQRFPVRFDPVNRAMVLFGIVPSRCRVELGEGQLQVRFAWVFRMRAALTDVRAATSDHDPVQGWGAHVWRRTWLVNGSSSGIVRIELDPPARGYAVGCPVRVCVLRVSVEDPEGLIAALAVVERSPS